MTIDNHSLLLLDFYSKKQHPILRLQKTLNDQCIWREKTWGIRHSVVKALLQNLHTILYNFDPLAHLHHTKLFFEDSTHSYDWRTQKRGRIFLQSTTTTRLLWHPSGNGWKTPNQAGWAPLLPMQYYHKETSLGPLYFSSITTVFKSNKSAILVCNK